MQRLTERQIDAWTTLAAEPAVRAAERAIGVGSPVVLRDALALVTETEARRRLEHVRELKARADTASGDYLRAAEELRAWAAGVYLAAVGNAARPATAAKPRNPYTEESLSMGRHLVRPPFPGQRRRTAQELRGADLPRRLRERVSPGQRSGGHSRLDYVDSTQDPA